MNTEDIIRTQQKKRMKNVDRPLIIEYLRRWYIIILTVFMCFPGYATEVLLYNFFVLKQLPHFLSAIMAIFLGGLISTLPFFILSIYLASKKKKYYAIAFGICVLEIVGMIFFLYNQMVLTGM